MTAYDPGNLDGPTAMQSMTPAEYAAWLDDWEADLADAIGHGLEDGNHG